MRFATVSLFISILMVISLDSCTLLVNDNASSTLGGPEVQAFQRSIMTSFDTASGSAPTGSRALTPFHTVTSSGARATVPVFGATSIDLPISGSVSGSQSNYPEPGQTSSWTIAYYSAVGGKNLYRIDVTTIFASEDPRATQVESYLIKDINGDGKWTTADTIVDTSGTDNSAYRLQNHLVYRDGSTQDDIITTVKFAPNGWAAFDINGSLDYPSLFIPVADTTATYSSVVAYTRTFSSTPSYTFWSGSSVKTIVGIRYYTEHLVNGNTQLQADMAVFEKAVTDLSTVSGNFVDNASSLFLSGVAENPNPTFLSQTFLRQRIVYGWDAANTKPVYSSAARDTRIKTLVVNISGQKDFYITKINNQAATLTSTSIDPTNGTLFIPSGDATEVLADTPAAAADIKLTNSSFKTGDASQVQIINPSYTGDLGALWASLDQLVAVNSPSTSDVSGDLTGTADIKTFSGEQGIILTGLDTLYAYTAPNQGTVQAWVYINAQSDTAGLVHAGKQSDFSDELWSLQFMGNKGQLAFSLSTQSPYKYDWIGSTINLNTKKWYYVVTTWNLAANSMKLYINGSLNKSGSFSNCKTNSTYSSHAPVVIGSQFYDSSQVLAGYYGFNGKINGVLIDNTVWTASAISAQYNAYKNNTSGW